MHQVFEHDHVLAEGKTKPLSVMPDFVVFTDDALIVSTFAEEPSCLITAMF